MKSTMALTAFLLLALLAAGNTVIYRGHRNVMMTRSLGHCTAGLCLIFPHSRMRMKDGMWCCTDAWQQKKHLSEDTSTRRS